MSGLPYSNMRSVLQDMSMQYGVSNGLGIGESLSGMPLLGTGLSLLGNIFGTYFQNKNQIEMYNAYMSPQARMAQMRAAGINTNAAAEGISGSSAPQMNAAAPTNAFTGVGEQLGQSVNTALTADNIRANTQNIEANTEGQKIANRFESQTFDDRAAYLKNQGLISNEEYKQAAELSRQYPEMLDQTIEQMRSNIRKNDKQVEVFDQQINNLKKEIDKMEAEIKKLKSDEAVNYAMVGEIGAREQLEIAEKALTEKKSELAGIEKQKAELGADSNTELKYREIENSQGEEAADKWLDSQYKIVNKIEQGIQDANVMTQEQRKIIASYDQRIARAEKYLQECEDRYYNAGPMRKPWLKGPMDAAAEALSNLVEEKAEKLRRLGNNESKSYKAGPIGTSYSK